MTLENFLAAAPIAISWLQRQPKLPPVFNQLPLIADRCVWVYAGQLRGELFQLDDYAVSSCVSAGGCVLVKIS